MNEALKTRKEVPEWVITYGDIMSLLLTFFIMLAAMSEIKLDDNKYKAVIESLRMQFGFEATAWEVPGESAARNSTYQFLTNLGRARQKELSDGGAKVKAASGDKLQVQALRQGRHTIVGAAIYFEEDLAELPESGQEVLDTLVPALIGKPQKIEIRGHTSRKPVNQRAARDHWDLGYLRCYNTMQYLIVKGIDPERIRLSSAAAHEPLNNDLVPSSRKRNARVEVVLWDEQVEDYSTGGSADSQNDTETD